MIDTVDIWITWSFAPETAGQLTTTHAASSSGKPVVVDEEGTAWGPVEGIISIAPRAVYPPEARPLFDAARQAGYHVAGVFPEGS